MASSSSPVPPTMSTPAPSSSKLPKFGTRPQRRLPNELLDLIARELHDYDHPHFLSSTLSVSRAWYTSSLRHLYHTIIFRSPQQCYSFLQTVSENELCGKYVKRLAFEDMDADEGWISSRDLRELMERLVNCRELRVHNIAYRTMLAEEVLQTKGMKSVHELYMHQNPKWRIRHFMARVHSSQRVELDSLQTTQQLLALPSLRSLDLGPVLARESLPSDLAVRPTSLTTLRINSIDLLAPDMARIITSTCFAATSLDLQFAMSPANPSLEILKTLFASFPPTLYRLYLHIMSDDPTVTSFPPHLDSLIPLLPPSLRVLRLMGPYFSAATLSSLPSSLERYQFAADFPFPKREILDLVNSVKKEERKKSALRELTVFSFDQVKMKEEEQADLRRIAEGEGIKLFIAYADKPGLLSVRA